jgi:hypothetical protein
MILEDVYITDICIGEPWVPAESTLLQVIISIQAMILCEEPWYNEPGREAAYRKSSSGQSPAASYNQNIRQHTVHTAMLEWLDKPPPLWKDVIDQHFTTNADKILHTAVEWSKSKIQPGYARYSDLDDEIDDNVHPGSNGPSIDAPRFSVVHPSDITSMLPRLQTALQKYGATLVVPKDLKPATQKRPTPRPKRALSKPNVAPSLLYPPPPFPPPPPPPMPTHTHPYVQAGINPNYHGYDFGSSGGPGRTLGSDNGEQSGMNASNTVSGSRGGFNAEGRYETRSSTRGRGGSGITSMQGVVAGTGSVPPQYPTPWGHGGSVPSGHGGFSQDEGREAYGAWHGAWSGRGGRGGRGGSQ